VLFLDLDLSIDPSPGNFSADALAYNCYTVDRVGETFKKVLE